MKSLLKVAATAVLVAGLAACSTNSSVSTTPSTPAAATAAKATSTPVTGTVKHKTRKCAMIKAQLRNMDRQAPGAQAKVQQLENQLEALNCGVK